MLTIWKYVLRVDDAVEVEMPAGAAILVAGTQDPRNPALVTVWAQVDDQAATATRRFLIAGTGHDLAAFANARYVGTVVVGPLVWHVFDDGEVESEPTPPAVQAESPREVAVSDQAERPGRMVADPRIPAEDAPGGGA